MQCTFCCSCNVCTVCVGMYVCIKDKVVTFRQESRCSGCELCIQTHHVPTTVDSSSHVYRVRVHRYVWLCTVSFVVYTLTIGMQHAYLACMCMAYTWMPHPSTHTKQEQMHTYNVYVRTQAYAYVYINTHTCIYIHTYIYIQQCTTRKAANQTLWRQTRARSNYRILPRSVAWCAASWPT